MSLRSLLPACACLLAGCSVFPDSPPQVVTPSQDSGADSDASAVDAPDVDAADPADARADADASDESDAPLDDAPEDGDAGDVLGDAPDHCYDKSTNETETDTDCGGGECLPCGKNKKCLVPSDCTSGVCGSNKKCD